MIELKCTMMKFVYSILCLCLCACLTRVQAQTNEGTEFWFGFMEHRNVGTNTMVAMITSRYNTSGTVRLPFYNWQQNFTVSANTVTFVQIPLSAEHTTSEQVADKGVVVQSQAPVSVYIHQYHASRSEATLVLPVSSLGTEYYVLSHAGIVDQGQNYPSELLVVGMEDNTNVEITLSAATEKGLPAGSVISVMLDRGESYQVQAANSANDLTGSRVKADKKVNVFGGGRWIGVPLGCCCRDNLLEQMPPLSTWGKQFVTAPFAQMPYDVYRIIASENGTNVTVTRESGATQSYTINAGKWVEYQSPEATLISANKPVLVGQYLIGSECSGHPVGDPAVIVVNSVQQIRDSVTLYNSPFEAIEENYLTIISKTSDYNAVTLDGQTLSTLNPDAGTIGDFTYARIEVQAGTHNIFSAGCGVIVTAYGYGPYESYAYGGGAAFSEINAAGLLPPGGCLSDTLLFDIGLREPRHSFQWDLGDGTTATTPTVMHRYAALGTYKARVIVTDNCLNTSDTLSRELQIILREAPDPLGDVRVCAGTPFGIGVNPVANTSYEWTGPNGFSDVGANLALPAATPELAGKYTVTGTRLGCASYPAEVLVTVNPLPAPELGRDTVVCPLESNPLLLLNPGNYQRYNWSDASSRPTLSVLNGGLYWVEVRDMNGCVNRDSIEVTARCPTRFYAPNVFSPNDDAGENAYFSILGVEIAELRLEIYDRWGELVFAGEGAETRWNGEYRGKPMPAGVYLWVAKISGYRRDGSTFTTTEYGDVTLIR